MANKYDNISNFLNLIHGTIYGSSIFEIYFYFGSFKYIIIIYRK